MLNINSVQNYIAQSVTNELSDRFHSKVSIGHVDYKLFNAISINDIYVEDLQRDTLLFAKQTDVHFSLWQLIKGNLDVTAADINQMAFHLKVNKKGVSNLDHILNALKKKPSADTTRVTYHVGRFKISNSTFSYFNQAKYSPTHSTSFNANKLSISNLNIDISLNTLTHDTLIARIRNISGCEKSGLCLQQFKADIHGSRKGLNISGLTLALPQSKFHLGDLQLKMDSLANLKHFATRVKLKIPLQWSEIALSDLKAFIPEFGKIREKVLLKGDISGRFSSLRFHNFNLKFAKTCELKADVDISGLPKINESFIYGQVNELKIDKNDVQDLISELTGKPFLLPQQLDQLGLLRFKGNVSGFLSNLVAYGNLNTKLGTVSTDILLKFENRLHDLTYNGTIKTNSFRIGQLLGNKEIGDLSFKLNTQGTKKFGRPLQGIITAQVTEMHYKNYLYKNLNFDGKYDGKGFDGKVDLVDPNIDAHFLGKIDLTQRLPILDFNLNLNKTNLSALHLYTKYPNSTLSFNGKMNMVGNSLDNINGFIRFDNISFNSEGKNLKVNELLFTSRIDKQFTHFTISSDFINGGLSGNFRYSTLPNTINKIVNNYLPALSAGKTSVKQNAQPNHIDVDIRLSDAGRFSEILELPYTLNGESYLKGSVDERSNKIDLSGSIPMMKSKKQSFENVTLHCSNNTKQLMLVSRGQMRDKTGLLSMYLHATAGGDSVSTQLGWQNAAKITNAGDIKIAAHLWKDNNRTAAQVSIVPTQVIISDSTWNIHPCKIDFNPDSTINIHDFRFDTRKQFLHINGIASRKSNEGISLNMNDLDVGFVLNLLRLRGISIDGKATGNATLFSVLQQPVFEADLSIKQLKLNNKLIGDGKLVSNWDKTNSQLLAKATFYNDKKDTLVAANAVYIPQNDSLDVVYSAHNFGIEFLSPYLETVVQNVRGTVTGKVRMFGGLKKGIHFETNAFLNQGQVSVKMLKTTYTINDSVHMTPTSIEFRNVRFYDQERNPGRMTAIINHNGNFQHMKYTMEAAANNILGLNTEAADNNYFYGKAYAKGKVTIVGDDKDAKITVNAVSQPQTKCYIQMGGYASATDNSFIHFINKKLYTKTAVTTPVKPASNFNVKVELNMDATPDAEMQLIVDPKGGDAITGKGNGSLRVVFDSFSPMKLYGTYTIGNNGKYLFTFQDIIRKEFAIEKEGTISWVGDPFNATMDIKALYSVKSASLKDLMDADQLTSVTRTTVPVNCVLKLTGNLMKPTVNLDLELPNSDDLVRQQVKGIVNTEEMMNRQIAYLLLFNRFYAPVNLRTNNNIVTNEGASLLSSTLSAQVNSLMTQALNTNSISVGFDYRQRTQQQNDEYQAQILIQPNNRWIVNGNVGYRYDNQGNARFIGDLDIEYLLTQSGKFRIKGYNHSIDRYQLRDAKTTQGVGFMYRENFGSTEDLFLYYWRLLTGQKKKTTDENKTTK